MAPRVLTRRRAPLVDAATPSAEPFRTLRLALQLSANGRAGSAVLFTSAEPDAGKSTIAANYALVSALSGERVLLVDADLRKPNLHEFFGLSRAPGLVEALATGGAVSQFVQSVPGLIQIDLMSAGRPIPRTGDLAASERMRDLLRQACEDYDLVVIDSPPVLSVSDATGIASHTGVSVVLVAPQSSKRRVVKKALRSLEMVEADVAGIVVNRSGRLEKYSGY